MEEKSRETDKISESITLADKLFNENSYKELYDLLIQFKVNFEELITNSNSITER